MEILALEPVSYSDVTCTKLRLSFSYFSIFFIFHPDLTESIAHLSMYQFLVMPEPMKNIDFFFFNTAVKLMVIQGLLFR